MLADGARADVLEELVRAGRLPNIAQLTAPLAEPLRRASTTMPSATGPAYLPFLTGRFAGSLNVPGIRWFDRFAYVSRQRWMAKRSYVGLGNRFYERDLDPSVQTLFHYASDHVNVFNPVRRGVRKDRDRLNRARVYLSPLAKYLGGWRVLDRNVRRETLKAVDAGARFVFSTFMGVDEASHDHGVRHAKTLDAYRFLDETVGEIQQRLDRRGELDRSRLILSSDHGLSDTTTHFALAEFIEGHGYKPLFYPRIWRRKPTAAVMVSGNALAHLYLPKRGSWAFRPRGAALWAEHGDLLMELAHHPSVAFLVYRDEEAQVVVQKADNRTRFRRGDGQIKFQSVGKDPLGLPEGLRVLDEDYFFRLTWDHPYPDAAVQLSQLFESPRAGDVIVVAEPGHDLRGRFEVPEHKASHGSLHRDHLLVPLLVNDPSLAVAPCRTVDVFVYILRQLGIPIPPDIDGRDLPLKESLAPLLGEAPPAMPLTPTAPTLDPVPVVPGVPPA